MPIFQFRKKILHPVQARVIFPLYQLFHFLARNIDVEPFCGGGMHGAIATMREIRLPGKIALEVNEMKEVSQKALVAHNLGMVIEMPLRDLCRNLVDRMV